MNIKEFSEELQKLIKNNEFLQQVNMLYKQQLLVILLNTEGKLQEGRLKDLDYDDLSKIDWDNITINIGHTSCSAIKIDTKEYIKSWQDVPMKQITFKSSVKRD